MKKETIKETARDLIALGGVPFFLLVLIRISLLENLNFLLQFIISGGIFILIFIFLRQNIYSGLGLISLFFTVLYYNNIKYTIFGSLVYLFLIASLFYLGYDKKKIIFGLLIGAFSCLVGYYFI